MKVAVDISLYPLNDEFLPPIQDVIRRLNQHDGIAVTTNPMSTQVRGDYDVVMPILSAEIRQTFQNVPKAVFAIRILNNPIGD
ncbi:MAG: YkoF family thiamine/hydroxymethylpyrimidine-binding protein [Woeseiaceae bacterium]